MHILYETVQSSRHGQVHVWSHAKMIARAGQIAHPVNYDHGRVFTNVCATASIQYFTRFASHGHLNVGFLVGADMVLPMTPRKTSHLVQRDRQKRLKSSTHAIARAFLGTLLQSEKSHFVNITTVDATMMYDSSVLSSPPHIANTCTMCLHTICLLIMLPRSRIAAIVGFGDRISCARTVSNIITAAFHSGRAYRKSTHVPLKSKPFR